MPPATVRSPARARLVAGADCWRPAARGGDERGTDDRRRRPPIPAVVQTDAGAVRGVVAADHRLFAGIPYAAPPVGPLRWQPPAPAPAWPGVRDATRPGPRCVQDLGSDLEIGRQTDEDCLTLNVWTPPPSSEPRPVMVWIHGGAFVNGSGGIYDARWLATRGDIVVVTINYRLGALGFLAHPALGPPGDVGNYGLADQQAALRWVRDNIAELRRRSGQGDDRRRVGGRHVGVRPPRRARIGGAVPRGDHPERAVPGAARTARRARGPASTMRPSRAAAIRRPPPHCLRALPADKLREPVWYYRIGDDELSGPVTGNDGAAGGSDDRRSPRGGRPGCRC